MWDALASGDAETDALLLADEFLGVYSSGFAEKVEHTNQLLAGPIMEWYKLSDARIKILADGVVLLAYRAHYARSKNNGENKQEVMYISSIWSFHSGVWKNVSVTGLPIVFNIKPFMFLVYCIDMAIR